MKRNRVIVCCFNIIISLSVVVFAIFTSIKYHSYTEIPYSMDEHVIEFYAFLPESNEDTIEIAKGDIETLTISGINTIIFFGDDSFGEGLFNKKQILFEATDQIILIKKESYLYDMLNGERKYTTQHGDAYVKGYYDDSFFAMNPEYDYIYPFFLSNTLDGNYIIESSDKQTATEILKILSDNGFVISNQKDYDAISIKGFIKDMATDVFVVSMLLCLLFIYGNYTLFLFVFQRRLARVSGIKWLLGAQKKDIFMWLNISYLAPTLLGTIIGLIICVAAFKSIISIIYIPFMAAIIHITISVFIIALSSLPTVMQDNAVAI